MAAIPHNLPAVDGASPPYYVTLVRDAEKRQQTAYNTRVTPAKSGDTTANFFASYYSAAGGGGVIPEADAVYHLFTFTCRELYAVHAGLTGEQSLGHASRTRGGSVSPAGDTSLISSGSFAGIVDEDVDGGSAQQSATASSTVRNRAEATTTTISRAKNASETDALVLDCFRLNHQLQQVAESLIANFKKHDVWEARQNALRNFLGGNRINAALAMMQAVKDGATRESIQGFVQLDEDSRSFLHVSDGLFAHVWASASEARRFMSCAQKVWQCIFEHRLLPYATPTSTILQTRGHAITFTAVIPVCGPPLPTLGGSAAAEVTKLLSRLLGVASVDEEEDSADSEDSGEFTLQDSGSQRVTFSTPPVNPKLYYGVDNRYYFMQPTLFGVLLEDVAARTAVTTSMAVQSNGALHTPLRLEAYPTVFPKGLCAEYRAADVLHAVRTTCVARAAAQIIAAVEQTPKLTEMVQNNVVQTCMHAAGCNMRHLYFVYAELERRLPSEGSRSAREATAIEAVEAELLCRGLKVMLRAELFCKAGEEDVMLVKRVNRLVSYLVDNNAAVWAQLMIVIREKFVCPGSFTLPHTAKMAKILKWFVTPRMGISFDTAANSFGKFSSASVPGSNFFFVPDAVKLTSLKKTEQVTALLKTHWEYALELPLSGEATTEGLCRLLRVLFLETIVNYQSVVDAHSKTIEGKVRSVALLIGPLPALHITCFLCEFYAESVPVMLQQSGGGTPLHLATELLEKTCGEDMKGPSRAPPTVHFCCFRQRLIAQIVLASPRATEQSRTFGLDLLRRACSGWLSYHEGLLLAHYGCEPRGLKKEGATAAAGGGAAGGGAGSKRVSIFKGGVEMRARGASVLDIRTNPRIVDDIQTIHKVTNVPSSVEQHVILALLSRAAHLDTKSPAHALAVKQFFRQMLKEQVERFFDVATPQAPEADRRQLHTFVATCHLVYTQDVHFATLAGMADAPTAQELRKKLYTDPEIVTSFTRCVGTFLQAKYAMRDAGAACIDAFVASARFVNTVYPVTPTANGGAFFGDDEANDVRTAVGSSSFASSVAMTLANHLIPTQDWAMALIVYHNMQHGIDGGLYSNKNTKVRDALAAVEARINAAAKIQSAFRMAATTGGGGVGSDAHRGAIAKRMLRVERCATAYFIGWNHMLDCRDRRMRRDELLEREATLRRFVAGSAEPAARDAIIMSFSQGLGSFALESLQRAEAAGRTQNAFVEAAQRLELQETSSRGEITNVVEQAAFSEITRIAAMATQAAAVDQLQLREGSRRHGIQTDALETFVMEILSASVLDEEALSRAAIESQTGATIAQSRLLRSVMEARGEVALQWLDGLSDIIALSAHTEGVNGLRVLLDAARLGSGALEIQRDEERARTVVAVQEIEDVAVLIITSTGSAAVAAVDKLLADCSGDVTLLRCEAEEASLRRDLLSEACCGADFVAICAYFHVRMASLRPYCDFISSCCSSLDLEVATPIMELTGASALAQLAALADECISRAADIAVMQLQDREARSRAEIASDAWRQQRELQCDAFETLERSRVATVAFGELRNVVEHSSAARRHIVSNEAFMGIRRACSTCVLDATATHAIRAAELVQRCASAYDATAGAKLIMFRSCGAGVLQYFSTFAFDALRLGVVEAEAAEFAALHRNSREAKDRRERELLEERERAARRVVAKPALGALGAVVLDAATSKGRALLRECFSALKRTVECAIEPSRRTMIAWEEAHATLQLAGETMEALLREALAKEERRVRSILRRSSRIVGDEDAARAAIGAERARYLDDVDQVFRILVRNMRADTAALHPHLVAPSKRQLTELHRTRDAARQAGESTLPQKGKGVSEKRVSTSHQTLSSPLLLTEAALLEELHASQATELQLVESHCFERAMEFFRRGRDLVLERMRKSAAAPSVAAPVSIATNRGTAAPNCRSMMADLDEGHRARLPAMRSLFLEEAAAQLQHQPHTSGGGDPALTTAMSPSLRNSGNGGLAWLEALGVGDFVPADEHFDVETTIVGMSTSPHMKHQRAKPTAESLRKAITALQAREVFERQQIIEHREHFLSTCRIERRDIAALYKVNHRLDHRRSTALTLLPCLAAFDLPPHAAEERRGAAKSRGSNADLALSPPPRRKRLPGIGYETTTMAMKAAGAAVVAAPEAQPRPETPPGERLRRACTVIVSAVRSLVLHLEATIEATYVDEARTRTSLLARERTSRMNLMTGGATATSATMLSPAAFGRKRLPPTQSSEPPTGSRSASPLRGGEAAPLSPSAADTLLGELTRSEVQVLGLADIDELPPLEDRLRAKYVELEARARLWLLHELVALPQIATSARDASPHTAVPTAGVSPPSYCSPRTLLLRDVALRRRDLPDRFRPINEQANARHYQLTHVTKTGGAVHGGAGGYTMSKAPRDGPAATHAQSPSPRRLRKLQRATSMLSTSAPLSWSHMPSAGPFGGGPTSPPQRVHRLPSLEAASPPRALFPADLPSSSTPSA